MANVRVTKDGACHKSCVYYRDCRGFFNRENRCPEWALDVPLRGKQAPEEQAFILTQHLQHCKGQYSSRKSREPLRQKIHQAARLYSIPEEMLLNYAKERLGLKRW